MRKLVCSLLFFLLILLHLYFIGTIIASQLGYSFIFTAMPYFSVFLAVLSGCILLLCRNRSFANCKTFSILVFICAPLSLINAIVFLSESRHLLVVLSAPAIAGCVYLLLGMHLRPLPFKIVGLATSAVVFLFVFLGILFGNMGNDTVVKTVESPNGKHYAEVIDSNQGATGGSTKVIVYGFVHKIDAVVFQLEKDPQIVYYGRWGIANTIEIYWKNDYCLVIDDVEYPVG